MRIKEIISEETAASLKSKLAKAIKALPDDNSSVKALQEIEDILQHVNAGGKIGIIKGHLRTLDDPEVQKAQKELARYLLSIEMTQTDRKELFTEWKNDNIVRREILLKPGKTSNFSDIFNLYDTNPAAREFIEDVMNVSALGQGKGEFGLSVLSSKINKQAGKGDLNIDGKGIEVKTEDGGAGRFTDQEVRPGPGFEQAARDLETFVRENGFKFSPSGLNLNDSIRLGQSLEGEIEKEYFEHIEKVISLIFHGTDINPIVQAIRSGDSGRAKQAYAQSSFNYYFNQKKDDYGILYINLRKSPMEFTFFRNTVDLTKGGLRLHAKTIYLSNVKDPRLNYPQISITPTSRN